MNSQDYAQQAIERLVKMLDDDSTGFALEAARELLKHKVATD